jgi:hypothetical protein
VDVALTHNEQNDQTNDKKQDRHELLWTQTRHSWHITTYVASEKFGDETNSGNTNQINHSAILENEF